MKLTHTLRTTYATGSNRPIYTVAIYAVCPTRAEAWAVIQRASGKTKGRKR